MEGPPRSPLPDSLGSRSYRMVLGERGLALFGQKQFTLFTRNSPCLDYGVDLKGGDEEELFCSSLAKVKASGSLSQQL